MQTLSRLAQLTRTAMLKKNPSVSMSSPPPYKYVSYIFSILFYGPQHTLTLSQLSYQSEWWVQSKGKHEIITRSMVLTRQTQNLSSTNDK